MDLLVIVTSAWTIKLSLSMKVLISCGSYWSPSVLLWLTLNSVFQFYYGKSRQLYTGANMKDEAKSFSISEGINLENVALFSTSDLE